MKKTIAVTHWKEVTAAVEVTFPVYRRNSIFPGWTSYSREDADGTEWEISESLRDSNHGNGPRLGYDIRCTAEGAIKMGNRTDRDQLLGKGPYACTPQEWAEILERAREWVAKVPL